MKNIIFILIFVLFCNKAFADNTERNIEITAVSYVSCKFNYEKKEKQTCPAYLFYKDDTGFHDITLYSRRSEDYIIGPSKIIMDNNVIKDIVPNVSKTNN